MSMPHCGKICSAPPREVTDPASKARHAPTKVRQHRDSNYPPVETRVSQSLTGFLRIIS